jgi:hypothetical protein
MRCWSSTRTASLETDGTLDDYFEDIYSKNPNFRRRWVDSLCEIVSYIQLIQAHDPTLKMYIGKDTGYDWQKDCIQGPRG